MAQGFLIMYRNFHELGIFIILNHAVAYK